MDLILFGDARENLFPGHNGSGNGAISPRYSPWSKAVSESSQVGELWAHVDLNHGPHPYQGCALTGLSYGPRLVVKDGRFYRDHQASGKSS